MFSWMHSKLSLAGGDTSPGRQQWSVSPPTTVSKEKRQFGMRPYSLYQNNSIIQHPDSYRDNHLTIQQQEDEIYNFYNSHHTFKLLCMLIFSMVEHSHRCIFGRCSYSTTSVIFLGYRISCIVFIVGNFVFLDQHQ
jgi:hypothetical protein